MTAWEEAAASGIVSQGDFDPALFRAFGKVTFSGGECGAFNANVRPGAACAVILHDMPVGGDIWQPTRECGSDTDSDCEISDADAAASATAAAAVAVNIRRAAAGGVELKHGPAHAPFARDSSESGSDRPRSSSEDRSAAPATSRSAIQLGGRRRPVSAAAAAARRGVEPGSHKRQPSPAMGAGDRISRSLDPRRSSSGSDADAESSCSAGVERGASQSRTRRALGERGRSRFVGAERGHGFLSDGRNEVVPPQAAADTGLGTRRSSRPMTVAQRISSRVGLGAAAASISSGDAGSPAIGDMASASDDEFRRKSRRNRKRGAAAVAQRGTSRRRPAPPLTHGRLSRQAGTKRRRQASLSSSSSARSGSVLSRESSRSVRTHREPGRSSDATSVGSIPAPLEAAVASPSRKQLTAATMDRRQRRLLDCDPVVRINLIFEYAAHPRDPTSSSSASAAPAARAESRFVFAYRYVPVPGLDAYAELGSRDFTVRECLAREAIIVLVSDLVGLRRRVPVPMRQWPAGWPDGPQGAGDNSSPAAEGPASGAPRKRFPEYIWCR